MSEETVDHPKVEYDTAIQQQTIDTPVTIDEPQNTLKERGQTNKISYYRCHISNSRAGKTIYSDKKHNSGAWNWGSETDHKESKRNF